MVHELAVFYNLKSESRDSEPHRFVSLIQQLNSEIPNFLLSECVEAMAPKLRPVLRKPARVIINDDVVLPVGRGWEKLPEKKETPKVAPADAWSDGEDSQENVVADESSVCVQSDGSSTRLEFLKWQKETWNESDAECD